MTTLEDVFLRLEEAAVDPEGTIVAVNTQPSAKRAAALKPPQRCSVEASFRHNSTWKTLCR